jgi:hypothetical protein
MIFCGKITKSQHLNEIEGEGFNVDDNEVRKIKLELELSKIRSEKMRKEGHLESDLEAIKLEARNASEDIAEMR